MKTIRLRHIIMLLFFPGFMVNALLNEYVYVKKQEHLFTHVIWKLLNVDKGYCKKRILSTELEVEENDQFVDNYFKENSVKYSSNFMQLFDPKAFDMLTPLTNKSEEVRSSDKEQGEAQEYAKPIGGISYPHDNKHSTSSLSKEKELVAEKISEPKEIITKSTKRRKRRRKRKIYSKEPKKGKRRKKDHDGDSSEQDYNLNDRCGSPVPFHCYPTRYRLKKENEFVEETKFVNSHENIGTNFDMAKHEESNIESDNDYSDQIQKIILSLEDDNNSYNSNISGDTLKGHPWYEHAYAISSSALCGQNELDMDCNGQPKISTTDSSTGTLQPISFGRNDSAQSIIEAPGCSIGTSFSNVFGENNSENFPYSSPGINNPFELLMDDNNELVSSFVLSHANIWQPAGFWGHYNEEFMDSFANSSLTVLQPTEIVDNNDIRNTLENSTLSALKPSIFADDSDDFLNALREASISLFENTGLVGDENNDSLSSTAGSSKGIFQTSGLIGMRNNEQANSDVGSSTDISHPAGLHGNANDDSYNSYVDSYTRI
ncbi:Plasmodium exported protein, unknown function [Plasmodium ovale]|uniref:Uncharacterized protein n=1 Tax=Plasmodium ovale TaxID=36330 RepID=A0A1C3KWL6_PLAOA|nr:Plasmodium exported protein, unknown function [Plasmodium ovale]